MANEYVNFFLNTAFNKKFVLNGLLLRNNGHLIQSSKPFKANNYHMHMNTCQTSWS